MMKPFRLVGSVLLACAASAAAQAQTAERPTIKEGDKWRFLSKVEELKNGTLTASSREVDAWVTRVGSHSFIHATKPVDSNLPPREADINLDWSRSQIRDGEDKIVGRPYQYPLKPGSSWDTDAADAHPAPGVKSLRNKLHFTVLGWEEVKVPAGTFKALKIETEGNWFREFEAVGPHTSSTTTVSPAGQSTLVNAQGARTPDPVGGRMYRLTWYVPEVKREVKMISEEYTPTGVVQHRTTQELESYSVN
jgi:hypothetical protein